MTLFVIVVLIMNLIPLGVDPVYKTYFPLILTSSPCSFSSDELVFLELIRNHPDQTRYLECSQELHNSAMYKSVDMATKGYIAHVSPSGEFPNEIVKRYGCNLPFEDKKNFVEALIIGTPDPVVGFNALMQSDGHKSLLLGLDYPFNEANKIGIAMVAYANNYFWTVHIAHCP